MRTRPRYRWVGHAEEVTALGQTVIKMRQDSVTGQLRTAQVPDHVDVLARMACGAQAHIVISAVAGGLDIFAGFC